eukprot:6484776-Amphidinium_carterae.1
MCRMDNKKTSPIAQVTARESDDEANATKAGTFSLDSSLCSSFPLFFGLRLALSSLAEGEDEA